MDSLHLKVAGVSLVLGAVLASAGAFTLGVGLLRRAFERTTAPARASNPNDSPVTVRGGSMVVLSPDAWNCSTDFKTSCSITSSSVTPEIEYVDGVGSPTAPNTPEHIDYASPIDKNWVITLIYRDDTGQKPSPGPKQKTLQICTKSDCTTDGSPVGDALYLKGDGMGTFAKEDLDRHGAQFDESCGKDPTTGSTTLCNHIYSFTVTTSSASLCYRCVDGACSIGIGAPPTVPKK